MNKIAQLNPSTGNLPRGGKRPWSETGTGIMRAAKCADGKTLFESSAGVVALAVHAVNAYPNLLAMVATMHTALQQLRTELRAMPRTPAVAKLLAIVDVGLAETAECEEADLP